jgi:hypothetical protein
MPQKLNQSPLKIFKLLSYLPDGIKRYATALVKGAKRALEEAGVKEIFTDYVAGSFELPLAAQLALKSGPMLPLFLGLCFEERHLILIMSAKV